MTEIKTIRDVNTNLYIRDVKTLNNIIKNLNKYNKIYLYQYNYYVYYDFNIKKFIVNAINFNKDYNTWITFKTKKWLFLYLLKDILWL